MLLTQTEQPQISEVKTGEEMNSIVNQQLGIPAIIGKLETALNNLALPLETVQPPQGEPQGTGMLSQFESERPKPGAKEPEAFLERAITDAVVSASTTHAERAQAPST